MVNVVDMKQGIGAKARPLGGEEINPVLEHIKLD